jgi:hypothetical protein
VLCALLLALAAAPEAPAAPLVFDSTQELSLRLGYDSNARRVPYALPKGLITPEQASADAPGPAVASDALLLVSGNGSVSAKKPGFLLRVDGAVGGKLFFDQNAPDPKVPYEVARARSRTDTERMIAAETRAVLLTRAPLGFGLRLSSYAKVRAQASGLRTYAFERSDFALERNLTPALSVRAGLAGQIFHAFDAPLFSSFGGGPEAGLSYRLSAKERLDADLALQSLAYPFARPVPLPDDDQVRRLDAPMSGSLVFTSARRIFVSSGLVVIRNLSSSLGESYTRERLFALVGTRLPAAVTVSARGTLQLTQYDEGVSVAQQLFLQEGDESQNSLVLLASRPILDVLHMEAQLAWYGNELAQGGVRFTRTFASCGVRLEL